MSVEETRQAVFAMCAKGFNPRDIAAYLKIDRGTASDLCRSWRNWYRKKAAK